MLRLLIRFHWLDTKDCVSENDVLAIFSHLNPDPVMPADDELVEDAGLFDHDNTQEEHHDKSKDKQKFA